MDINYWIILLVFYLFYQWMRKRKRGRSPQQERGPDAPPLPDEKTEEKGLPAWLKELGFPDLTEEVPEEPAEIEQAEEIPTPMTLKEEIEEFEIAEPEIKPVSDRLSDQLKIATPELGSKKILGSLSTAGRKSFWDQPEFKTGPGKSQFGDRILNVDSLREFIVLREILGPPRALQRYRFNFRK